MHLKWLQDFADCVAFIQNSFGSNCQFIEVYLHLCQVGFLWNLRAFGGQMRLTISINVTCYALHKIVRMQNFS